MLILTKIDDYDKNLIQSPDQVYYSSMVNNLIQSISKGTGMSFNDIFPVKNYVRDDDNNKFIDYMVLKALLRALYNAQDFFEAQSYK